MKVDKDVEKNGEGLNGACIVLKAVSCCERCGKGRRGRYIDKPDFEVRQNDTSDADFSNRTLSFQQIE